LIIGGDNADRKKNQARLLPIIAWSGQKNPESASISSSKDPRPSSVPGRSWRSYHRAAWIIPCLIARESHGREKQRNRMTELRLVKDQRWKERGEISQNTI